jgi:hypothetical protein
VRRTFSVLLVSIAALASAGSSACSRDAGAREAPPQPAASEAAAPRPAEPKVLAEATNPGVPMVVQVLDARRATADTVYVAFRVTNTGTGENAASLPPFGDAKAVDFCLITADGARRLFLLRNEKNDPVLDGDHDQPLKPGEHRLFQAAFPAPPAQQNRVTMVAGAYVLRNIPIAAQAPAR